MRIYDLGEADGIRFISMEYVDGEDLRTVLRRAGKFSPQDAIAVVEQVCRALDAAHSEGVIHRDLKPQNIMRDQNGRIVVMDFGLARSLGDPGMTQSGAIIGTLEYMSPEQALGSTLDQRSDIFSVGLIFYELLTGRSPYAADTAIASLMKRTSEAARPASEIEASVPKSLSAIVSRCLEREPANRYHSAFELLQQLTAWQISPGIKAGTLSRMIPHAIVRPSRFSLDRLGKKSTWMIDRRRPTRHRAGNFCRTRAAPPHGNLLRGYVGRDGPRHSRAEPGKVSCHLAPETDRRSESPRLRCRRRCRGSRRQAVSVEGSPPGVFRRRREGRRQKSASRQARPRIGRQSGVAGQCARQ